ncbi:hypothetical protein V500_09192 [Pseudogymnoascus sp. VKM F-4518 (FW-2643)]|nr:hypothetical protein V500_09192 [Pseudogymnoascus sp. VKM F-4518 (FW-2643)]
MTIDGRVLASPFEPGWEKDGFGYFINPENIPEIRTLKSIASNLPNLTSFEFQYNVGRDRTWDDWAKVSLRETLQSILAICPALIAHVKGIKIGSGYNGEHTIIIDPTRLSRQWDKSTPLLDATCYHLQALEITFEDNMSKSDLEWVEMFLLKCSTLEKLSIKNKSPQFTYHEYANEDKEYWRDAPEGSLGGDAPEVLFFYDIAAMPETSLPVQALMLENIDFPNGSLEEFIGPFKDTIRSIDFCRDNLNGDRGWPPFLEWLRENIPNLEKFGFQGITDNYAFVPKFVVCFESIFDNPELNFKALKGAPWRSYAKLSNGVLALDVSDEFSSLEMGKFFVNLDNGKYTLDSNPREDKQVYTMTFEGSNAGAREALRLLKAAIESRRTDVMLFRTPTTINM